MDITKNIIKNYLFEFIILEYNNKVKYGQPPTPIVFFYNNWLISMMQKGGYITENEHPDKLKEMYQDKFLDITWQALKEMCRDRVIKRRLLSSDDLLHWDLYVPTEKGLEIWEKFGKLVIIPSNLVDSLREELPEFSEDTEIVLEYINEAVNCYFQGMHKACCLCLASAGERALFAFVESFVKVVDDKYWVKHLQSTYSSLNRIDLIKEKIKSLIKQGDFLKKYTLVYSQPDKVFRKDLESLLRSMELMASIINLTRDDSGNPSLAISTIDLTFRDDLILGYVIGSYKYFRIIFILKEVMDNMIEFEE